MIEEDVMAQAQKIEQPVFKVDGKKLDLGCGNKKIERAFGVDYIKTGCTDFVWNLEKTLPKKFWNSYDLVYSSSVLDYIGNPLQFLQNCIKYAKPNGFVQVVVDNADYWRYHKKGRPFGNYHSLLWFKHSPNYWDQHKMMFQPSHIEIMFKMLGLKIVKKELFWRQSIDFLFPKHMGTAYFSIVGENRHNTAKKGVEKNE